MELIPISFHKIMQSKAYTVIVLAAESKQFAIYVEPVVGKHLQMLLMQEPEKRPHTHSLLASIFQGLDVHPIQVVINNVEDTIYYSRLFLEQKVGEQIQILEIDARPSDGLTLALMHNIPVFCSKEVLSNIVSIKT